MRLLTLLLLLAVGAFAQVKKPQPRPIKPYEKSLQAVVVTASDWNSIQGLARTFERKSVRSKWKSMGPEFPVVFGRNGLIWEEWADVNEDLVDWFKREGDGKSPAGLFPLTFAFGIKAKETEFSLPYTKLDEFTECVDDYESSFYNKVVNRMQVGNFDWKSSEKILAVGPQYEFGIFVAHNTYPVRGIRGSCIFLHVWKDANTPTSGCTAMDRSDLVKLLGWLDPARTPYLVQMPRPAYDLYQKKWKLPKLK